MITSKVLWSERYLHIFCDHMLLYVKEVSYLHHQFLFYLLYSIPILQDSFLNFRNYIVIVCTIYISSILVDCLLNLQFARSKICVYYTLFYVLNVICFTIHWKFENFSICIYSNFIFHFFYYSASKGVEILEAYEGTLEEDYPPDNERCEHSEMLLYKVFHILMLLYVFC